MSSLALRRAALVSTRSFRVAGVRAYTDGSTGANRPASSGDSFTRREKATEDLFIRKHEHEKLTELKKKLAEHKKVVADLEEKISNFKK